jgi:hypothetical protein
LLKGVQTLGVALSADGRHSHLAPFAQSESLEHSS